MPRHPWSGLRINRTFLQLFRALDVNLAVIAKINTRPNLSFGIGQLMTIEIVPAVADVKSSHKGYLLINYHHFLVVGPEEGNEDVVGMQKYFYI